MHRLFAVAFIAATVVLNASPARAATALTLVDESFADDAVAGGRAVVDGDASRFVQGSGELTASYDSGLPTSMLNWSLGTTLTQADSFRFEADFTMSNIAALDDNFAQVAFGLTNSGTTGPDRAGGDASLTKAFDVVTFDYFPNVSPSFGGVQSLTPTPIVNNGDPFFSSFRSPFGAESSLDAEGPLPSDVALTAIVEYDAAMGTVTLQVADASGLLTINAGGGTDGDDTTIVASLLPGDVFSVDQFSLALWEDTFAFPRGTSTTAADLSFTRVLVQQLVPTTTVPEPTSAALLGVGLLAAARRRRRASR